MTPRQADTPTAEAIFERAWADMHRSRRRRSILFGLGFAICLAIAIFSGQLRFEALLGLFG